MSAEYGCGFAEKSLRRMIQFVRLFPDREIVAVLSRELTWSHFVVAGYLTELPSKALPDRKLHESVARAKAYLESRGEGTGSPG